MLKFAEGKEPHLLSPILFAKVYRVRTELPDDHVKLRGSKAAFAMLRHWKPVLGILEDVVVGEHKELVVKVLVPGHHHLRSAITVTPQCVGVGVALEPGPLMGRAVVVRAGNRR